MGDIISMGLDVLGIETPQARAARQAGEVQAAGAQAGIDEQRRQFDISQEQAEPFRQAGLSALEQQQALMGLSGQEAQQAAFDQFTASPGQEFLQQRGQQALLRNQAAIGGLGGGNVRSALQQQGVGFAQQDLQNQLARLSGISGQGQQITGQQAQLGGQMATNVGNLMGAAGQAQASSILGSQQAQGQFGGQIGSVLAGGIGGAVSPTSTFGQGASAGLLGLF